MIISPRLTSLLVLSLLLIASGDLSDSNRRKDASTSDYSAAKGGADWIQASVHASDGKIDDSVSTKEKFIAFQEDAGDGDRGDDRDAEDKENAFGDVVDDDSEGVVISASQDAKPSVSSANSVGDLRNDRIEWHLDRIAELERTLRESKESQIELQRILEETNSVNQKREEVMLLTVKELEGKLAEAKKDINAAQQAAESAKQCDAATMISRVDARKEQEHLVNELSALRDMLAESQKNATMLAIKMRIAKNERNVAKTSLETSELELESCTVECTDEKAKLNKEINSIRIALQKKGCSSASSQGTSQSMDSSKCDWQHCFDLSGWFFSHDDHRDDTDKTKGGSASKDLLDAAISGQQWLRGKYWTTLHPVLYTAVVLQYEIIFRAMRFVWQKLVIDVVVHHTVETLLPTCHSFYQQAVVPWVQLHVYPVYQHHLEAHVNATCSRAFALYESDVEPFIDEHLFDTYDFIVGRIHFICYFTVRFFTDEDLIQRIMEIAIDWLDLGFSIFPRLVQKLADVPLVLDIFEDNAMLFAGIVVYCCAALLFFLVRRIIFGIAAMLLMVILMPSLLLVFLIAKFVSLILPRSSATTKRSGTKNSKLIRGSRGDSTTAKETTSRRNDNAQQGEQQLRYKSGSSFMPVKARDGGGTSGMRYLSHERGEGKPAQHALKGGTSTDASAPQHIHREIRDQHRSPPSSGPPPSSDATSSTTATGNTFQYKGVYPAYQQVNLDNL